MLSNTQHAALTAFEGVRAFTETGLSRAIQCDKAVARTIIKQLESNGLLRKIGPYEWNISTTGQLYLRQQGKAKLPEKPTPAPAPKPDPVQPLAPQVAIQPEPVPEPEPEPEPLFEMKTNRHAEQVPFDVLVRQGLARLNAQLGYQPPKIERADLKIEALNELARIAQPLSREIAIVLADIVKDLEKFSQTKDA